MADAEEEKMSQTNLPVLPSLAGNSAEGAKDSGGRKQHGFRHEEKKKVTFTKEAKDTDGNKTRKAKKSGGAGTEGKEEKMYVPKRPTAEKKEERPTVATAENNINAATEERKNNSSNSEGNASM